MLKPPARLLLGLLLSSTAAGASETRSVYPPYPREPDGKAYEVTVSAPEGAAGSRRFTLRSTASQRENGAQQRTVLELASQPFVASGNSLFDALFALSLDDARLNSVSSIRDDAYNQGRPIACQCFQTGEKWHYVWTRDLSYALDLGLAGVDPDRAVASLLFKTSGFRPGVPIPAELKDGSTQIVQDTGSGGSWPISTDRTAWALGAERTLAHLGGQARSDFARKAYDALRGTVEADRLAAFDARDGLYGGEHSFLDWREQTYAPWIVEHLSAMAQSKALSTNVLQYRALSLAARLAEELGDGTAVARYHGWAEALRKAIDRRFWVREAGLYATFTTPDRNASPVAKYDLLGNALAVLSGVAGDKAGTIIARYPFAPFGPPVVWPQAQDQFIYHNRAMWPFVTAYALKAAATVGNVDAVDRALEGLMRGAALNLSNMENLEWLTGKAQFDNGPEINSRRQLWSVGGYYGAVVGTVFGWDPDMGGISISPFLTTKTRALFGNATIARLGRLTHHGKPVEILLRLPPSAAPRQVYAVRDVRLNGRAVGKRIAASQLAAKANLIEVRFGLPQPSAGTITQVPIVPALSRDDPRVFMPLTPSIGELKREGRQVSLSIPSPKVAAPLAYSVLRDGRLIAAKVGVGRWRDPAPTDADLTVCYSVIATDTRSGLSSHPSLPACLRGSLAQTVQAEDPRISTDGEKIGNAGSVPEPTIRLDLGKWLEVPDIIIARSGTYALSTRYDNHVFALNTGITNAVKRITLIDDTGGRRQAMLQMPHVKPEGESHPIRQSTRAYFNLPAGRYRIELSDFFNMSALAANATYTGPGGAGGPVNRARIAAIDIDAVEADLR